MKIMVVVVKTLTRMVVMVMTMKMMVVVVMTLTRMVSDGGDLDEDGGDDYDCHCLGQQGS